MAFEKTKGKMGKNIDTMQDLLITQLQDVYSAEQQILEALPKMEEEATAIELKRAFADHNNETREQKNRLETIFNMLDMKAKAHKCKAMEGLLKEGEEMIARKGSAMAKDAGLIAAAQRVEHYEISAYRTLHELAQRCGEEEIAKILKNTLDEENAADERLSKIARTQLYPHMRVQAEA